ncbi:uncharacterized protein LOC111617336, partial [Centruroides sculpturatus]|uniref:uncharacterized protein LOC111617336 n=1 Tax=Centruroides sculpturatus TaxID=218467 RepID=UPI000C6DB80A
MGDLPAPRVQPSRPFTVTRLDYAGPYLFKLQGGRGVRSSKCYVAIFVCFSTKAVHFELVSDLSTPRFIAALKRFIAHHGKPVKIMSDCASNFKKANKSSELAHFTTGEDITWIFNPPAAPHFGGIWEFAVKSKKFHLRRVIGSTLLTY